MDHFTRRRASSSAAHHQDNATNSPQRTPPSPPPPSLQPPQTGARYIAGAPSFESLRAPSNIRIRRLPSSLAVPTIQRLEAQNGSTSPNSDHEFEPTRRRSFSAPERPQPNDPPHTQDLPHQKAGDAVLPPRMPPIIEGQQAPPHTSSIRPGYPGSDSRSISPSAPGQDATSHPEISAVSATATHSANQKSRGARRSTASSPRFEYESDVIDLLDLVDPEVRTIGTLTNLQNSLFVPDLGGLVNRRPTYTLSSRPTSGRVDDDDLRRIARSRAGRRALHAVSAKIPEEIGPGSREDIELYDAPRRTISISSKLSDSRYAVLPHGVSLEGWSDEEVAELNDHVRHLLHSKREGFKRSMRGFKQYISKPLGLFVFVYATLVTLFGAAWVFALIGWVYVGNRQDYVINLIDLILVALFALVGDGLAPFRAVDTYHMCFIAHYHRLTWKLRKKRQLPDLVDHNDLPDRQRSVAEAEEAIGKEEQAEYSVLSPAQEKRLRYHEAKFNKSHTFYKPHETATHHAFPLRLMVAAVLLLDAHSLLQIALGTCTWSIDHKVRPEALTATILSFSIASNILAGVMISIGDHKTRKKDVLERIFRQGLTEQALRRMAKKHERGKMSLALDRSKLESEDILMVHDVVNGNIPLDRKKSRPSEEFRRLI